jgi:hypothetical protein
MDESAVFRDDGEEVLDECDVSRALLEGPGRLLDLIAASCPSGQGIAGQIHGMDLHEAALVQAVERAV